MRGRKPDLNTTARRRKARAKDSRAWGRQTCAHAGAASFHVVSKLKRPVFLARDLSGLSDSCSRRAGGKVGIPRGWRDFQAGWESPAFGPFPPASFRSPSRRHFACGQAHLARCRCPSRCRPVSQSYESLQSWCTIHRATPKLALHRTGSICKLDSEADRVIPFTRTFECKAKMNPDPGGGGHKRAAPFCGLHLEARYELPRSCSRRNRLAASASDLQNSVPRAIVPARSRSCARCTPRLRRVGWNICTPTRVAPVHLRQAVRTRPTAHLGG